MTSSVAVFGGDLPEWFLTIVWAPQSSYGTQKAMADLLLSDYARKGFVDARSVRLPTIVVRPGKPNLAASSFASGIIREPLHGTEAVCPVLPETVLWLMSPRLVISNLLHAFDLPADRLGRRVINLPGLSIRVGEMIAALERIAGPRATGLIRLQRIRVSSASSIVGPATSAQSTQNNSVCRGHEFRRHHPRIRRRREYRAGGVKCRAGSAWNNVGGELKE